MDGSHSKDGIPLEPEGYPRFEYTFAVHAEAASFSAEID